jgi:hypothetical protein
LYFATYDWCLTIGSLSDRLITSGLVATTCELYLFPKAAIGAAAANSPFVRLAAL